MVIVQFGDSMRDFLWLEYTHLSSDVNQPLSLIEPTVTVRGDFRNSAPLLVEATQTRAKTYSKLTIHLIV
jgi:hypothetical protein